MISRFEKNKATIETGAWTLSLQYPDSRNAHRSFHDYYDAEDYLFQYHQYAKSALIFDEEGQLYAFFAKDENGKWIKNNGENGIDDRWRVTFYYNDGYARKEIFSQYYMIRRFANSKPDIHMYETKDTVGDWNERHAKIDGCWLDITDGIKIGDKTFKLYSTDEFASKSHRMSISSMQEEIFNWAHKNFGEFTAEDQIFGMVEELGEIAHVVLKTKQGIRGYGDKEKARELIADGLADVFIFALNAASCYNIDAERTIIDTVNKVLKRDWANDKTNGGMEPDGSGN